MSNNTSIQYAIKVNEQTFEFNNADDLKKQLRDYINSITPRWKDYFTAPKKALLNSSLTLKVAPLGKAPRYLTNTLRHIGQNYPNIKEISINNSENYGNENDFIQKLNAIFENKLNQNLKGVIKTRDEEIYRRRKKILIIPIAVSFLIGAHSFFTGITLSTAIFSVIKEALKNVVLITSRQKYLDSAMKPYTSAQQISAIENHRVLTALEKGRQSTGVCRWLLSNFSYSAWRHPFAYAAGLELALENKEDLTHLIHERYKNFKP